MWGWGTDPEGAQVSSCSGEDLEVLKLVGGGDCGGPVPTAERRRVRLTHGKKE